MSTTADFAAPDAVARFAEAVADDLMALAVLHHRELGAECVSQLRTTGFPDGLALVLESARAVEALDMMRKAVALLPQPSDSAGFDRLAADYADVYLTHKLGASPCESVWLDEDGLMLQGPMFAIREWYLRHGLVAENWRARSEDHLVLQLQFVAHLLHGPTVKGLAEAARFLDAHLLLWIGDFAALVVSRCATPFYAALAALTVAYTDELRDLLAAVLDEPRPDPELSRRETLGKRESAARRARMLDIPVASIPATTPSW
jgi:TorA maturation chaperone TorD